MIESQELLVQQNKQLMQRFTGGKDAAMVYTDMGLQDRLVRLEQELQEIPKNNIPTMPGVSSRVIWSDIPLSIKEMPPLFMCQLATMLSLTIQWMVAVFLSDRFRGAVPGLEPAIYTPFCPPSPCIVMNKFQGVPPPLPLASSPPPSRSWPPSATP